MDPGTVVASGVYKTKFDDRYKEERFNSFRTREKGRNMNVEHFRGWLLGNKRLEEVGGLSAG
jgi:hypothetical protein